MRIHAGDSELVALLLDHFEQQTDCIAIQVAETEIEVSLLGSYGSEAHDAAVEQRVTRFRRQPEKPRRPGPRASRTKRRA